MIVKIKWLALLLALSLLTGALSGCAGSSAADNGTETTVTETVATTPAETEPPKPQTTFVLCEAGEDIDFHTDLQKGFLQDNYIYVAKYAHGTQELSRPLPVVLEWTVESEEPSLLKYFLVRVSEDPDMADAKEYKVFDVPRLNVYNCRLGTEYYWNVEAVYRDASYLSQTGHFSIGTQPPRNMYVDGITNVRDLGGWQTTDGGQVRQGLIYRCSRLNSNHSANAEITYDGIRTMVNDMGIKTEIDLRLRGDNGDITQSLLGTGVTYHFFPMGYSFSSGDILTNNTLEIRHVFSVLGNEENYPIIFHCSIGTDRTGMIAFLVNGLLGVSEEDLSRDYLYSNFGNIGSSRDPSAIRNYLADVKKCPGDTLDQKIYNYLRSIGIKEAELDTVIRVLKQKD